ncbi:hypothetical protein GN157_06220 [Flavobacterium rakeshii]|uniref:Tetratricopeptide repeat protein n=2 Tax=Flavobacterium rakeshii TaxID=1038845 RepID=A0A6N8HA37_9FLAO|nr:hypothetical protein [Flavobacterium rakeshii]
MLVVLKRVVIMLALIVMSAVSAFAQQSRKIDSIIKANRLTIYKNPDETIRIGDSIYEASKSSGDKIRGLILISNAYSSKRDYQQALKYCLRADSISKKLDEPNLKANLLNSIAVIYQQLKVYDKAMEYLDENDRYLDTNPVKDSIYLRATNNVVRGLVYKEDLSCELAIPFFNKAIEQYKKLNTTNEQPNISITLYNRAYCFLALERYEEAKESFELSIVYAEHTNAKSLKAFSLKGLSEVYTHEKEYEKAIGVLEEARQLAEDVGDLILNRGIYLALADNYLAVNNWEKYKEYRKLFLENQYIIKESERRSISDSIDELTANYEQKTANLTNRYYICTGIIILLILLAVFVILRYHKKAKKSLNNLKLRFEEVKKARKGMGIL